MTRCQWCREEMGVELIWCSQSCWYAEGEYWELVRLVDFGHHDEYWELVKLMDFGGDTPS